MPSETVKYFYEEIKLITEGIGKTGLPEKLIEAAKEQDLDKMKIISRQFKRDNLELWGRMDLFYEDYGEEDHVIIFYAEPDDKLFPYNPNDIEPLNLIALQALSKESVIETDLFMDWRQLQDSIETKGYKEIAEYMENTGINDLNDLIRAYED